MTVRGGSQAFLLESGSGPMELLLRVGGDHGQGIPVQLSCSNLHPSLAVRFLSDVSPETMTKCK